MTDSLIVPEQKPDDELFAYHEAGHAVAMWVLGLGIKIVTIQPKGGLRGYAKPALHYEERHDSNIHYRRFIVEQHALYLHAGDVATRLLHPDVPLGQAAIDHKSVHEWMYNVEDNGTLQITWCNHLWQRAYDLLHWPGNWFLVRVAQQMSRTACSEREATRYLQLATSDSTRS